MEKEVRITFNLGLAKSAVYLRENFSSKTDYLQIKEEIFANKSSEEIYNEIVKWKAESTLEG